MKKEIDDPRVHNDLPSAKNTMEYIMKYATIVNETVQRLDGDAINRAFDVVFAAAKSRAEIFVAGNGGSAAISDHLVCDWTKGTCSSGEPPMRVHSLVANGALFSALANDFGYEVSISKQIEMFVLKGDVIVLISSSGNSPNIIAAVKAAQKIGATVIGLSGFSGGALKELADISIHVPLNNYGMVEDTHQMVMHCLAQFIARTRDGN